jgi:hypothetical protein
MEENLGCIDIARRITEKHMQEIDVILGNKPELWTGYGGAGAREIRTL